MDQATTLPPAPAVPTQPWKEVPIDWEPLEDAFENNAPEVHSYLHVPTGDVLRLVDGVADPTLHARIAADPNYLRVEPVTSREQYRWMERYIPLVEDKGLQQDLAAAIDGKGAFRRFKDALMTFGTDRERWFAFRSERLRLFIEAWLNNHALNPIKRATLMPGTAKGVGEQAPPTIPGMDAPPSQPALPGTTRTRNGDALRRRMREIIEVLGHRELDQLLAFADFLQGRRALARPSLHSATATSVDVYEDVVENPAGPNDPERTAPDTAPDTAKPSSAKVSRRDAASKS